MTRASHSFPCFYSYYLFIIYSISLNTNSLPAAHSSPRHLFRNPCLLFLNLCTTTREPEA